MRKIMTIDGNEACSHTSYYFTEIAGIYPITPSSPMAEHIDEWSKNGRLNIFNDKAKVIEMQSEAGAAGLVHGSLVSGLLTSTYTASQGLLLMIPNMYKIAGEMLPLTMHVAARSLSTHALSIFGDHQDIYAARMTGFAMLASSSVQDAAVLSAVAHLSAIKSSLPFMHFFDGFRTSHEIGKVKVLEKEDYEKLIDEKALQKFRSKAMNPLAPNTRGTAENDDIYFQHTEARNLNYEELPDIVNRYMKKMNTRMRMDYKPFNYYGHRSAKKVIVAMGSVCETIKETIDALALEGEKLGLLEVHLYRPFSSKYFLKELPATVQKIAVLDRTKEAGSVGEPLYLDVCSILNGKKIKVVGGRYGLSSKNTTPSMIKAVYEMLEKPKHNFTIGIEDDVTHLSLEPSAPLHIGGTDDFLFYGYGSDGMISASKSIIKMVGDFTSQYVQGYFQYDSKKSGGVTASHLRFSKKPIRKTYYVENPRVIVVTKESYLKEFDTLKGIQENGIFILNTSKNEQEIQGLLTDHMKLCIEKKNIHFYAIDAYDLARKVGLGTRISTIMESAILKVTELIDYEKAKTEMKNFAKEKFGKKGEEVVQANYLAIEGAPNYLKEIKILDKDILIEEEKTPKNITKALFERKGNELPVSAFLKVADGRFAGATSQLEKKGISDIVPSYLMENCIECAQCSLVCPHGVIRPYQLSEEEYENAPSYVKNKCKKSLRKGYYYTIAVSVLDCTGCGLCMKTCPGLKGVKALLEAPLAEQVKQNEQKRFDYLSKNIKDKGLFKIDTVQGSQLQKCNFEFCGACAGCGETPYIKLLTQLLGEKLMIANATGCSSIYGGSMPSLPYSIPWGSSLFEDNAEYGFGIMHGYKIMRQRIERIMKDNLKGSQKELFEKWLQNKEDFKMTKEVYENLNYEEAPAELKDLKDYIVARNLWTIGGDGWAYDIGFSGIDHVLASGENVNILVLDSEVYSNTGGQSSKATGIGQIASFASSGKKTTKKDLARIAMCYPGVYVAAISLGYNFIQTIKTLKEAADYDGPSIVIAYSPCISHGIKGGMSSSIEEEKLATMSGYFPTFRYHPETDNFLLYSKNVNFDLYEEFLSRETRYANLKKINKEHAQTLLDINKKSAMKRFEYLKGLEK
ncbi:MAG: pyruvate:ferredoxin (flavodoxin) oxidoreductase [Bacilli bacterium]|nr:pyruvate:ferredoxin (flavodoxin) oxidoreductase [Bacilli bacterium]